ncbi:MAG: hypothetical protein NTY98_18945 [Verrucomicrobia bacterium]|nr:hypothetical protein [Verrucomicrobiota bacterium]
MDAIIRTPWPLINVLDSPGARPQAKKTTLPELGAQEKNPQNLNPINPAGLI